MWFQAAHHIAGDKALVVVADDTDVFALLLHYRHCGAINAGNVYLESPLKGRAVIDIDATVQENMSIIPGLLAAHALTGCDTVASHYGIGKGILVKVLRAGNQHIRNTIKHKHKQYISVHYLFLAIVHLEARTPEALTNEYFIHHSFLLAGVVDFDVFGDSSLPAEQYHKLLADARAFILACYKLSDCESLSEARVKA